MAATGTLSAAKRSYPTSEVRGRSREDPIHEGQRPRGITPCPRAGAAAEECQTATAQERPRGATPCPRSGAATRGVTPHPRSGVAGGRRYPKPLSLRPGAAGGRTNPTPWLRGHRGPRGAIPRWRSGTEAVRRYPSSKEHWLCFAGAAVKRYPMPKVRET